VKTLLGLTVAALAVSLVPAPTAAQAASTVQVSVGTGGASPDGASRAPAISASGRSVAFASDASNLVAGDTNGSSDIFVRNLQAGTTRRVSVRTGGGQANGDSSEPAISAEGRLVAFTSDATNLVGGDTNASSDVFIRDLWNGTTTRVSVGARGVQANGPSRDVSLSGNGRFVVFSSDATNLTGGDSNGETDVFVRDLNAATTRKVSTRARYTNGESAAVADGGADPAVSEDGRFVAYYSVAVDEVGTEWPVVLRRDRWTGAVQPACAHGFGICYGPVEISGDGQGVAYQYSIPAGQLGQVTYFDGRELWWYWNDAYDYSLSHDGETVAFTTDITTDPRHNFPLYLLTKDSRSPELIADDASEPSLAREGCRLAYTLTGRVYVLIRC
jgi:Tol biopolymer transport system component